MYGSYGSYSCTPAMEIPSRSGRNNNNHHTSTHYDDSCAFPSWPRRDSLSGNTTTTPRASSYLSDEDLAFLSEPVFATNDNNSNHYDARSASSSYSTPSPQLAPTVRHISDEEIEELRREQALRQREYIAVVMREKELRKRAKAAKAKRAAAKKGASSASPSPKVKLAAIAE